MPVTRVQRPNIVIQNILTTALGASDATTLQDFTIPSDNATLVQIAATTKTAGVGSGSFTLQVMSGAADAANVAIGPAALVITAASAAGTVQGSAILATTVAVGAGGQHLALKTVKTGTVSTGVVMLVTLFWQI